MKYGKNIYRPEVLFNKIRENAEFFTKKHKITGFNIEQVIGRQSNDIQYSKEDLKNGAKRLINDLFYKVKNNIHQGDSPVILGNINEEARNTLSKISGLNFKNYSKISLNPSDLRHIYNDHYETNEKDKGNNIPLTDKDIENITEIVSSPDDVIFVGKNKKGENGFIFLKKSENNAYNLVHIFSNKKSELSIRTLYKTKKDVSQRANELKKPMLSTSEMIGAKSSSDAKIPNLIDFATDDVKKSLNIDRHKAQYSFLKDSDFDANGNVKPQVLKEIEEERAKIKEQAIADGSFMKAPNGENSKLNEQQWVDVRTKRFKEWFGDWEADKENASKVVDENGEPMLVYHGTPSQEFNIFNRSNNGIYFTSDVNVAEKFKEQGSYVISINGEEHLLDTDSAMALKDEIDPYLDIDDIKDYNLTEYYANNINEALSNGALQIGGDYFINKGDEVILKDNENSLFAVFLNLREPKIVDFNNETWGGKLGTIEENLDKNKDGFIAENIVEGGLVAEGFDTANTYVVFNPNQIKSATDNVGTYSDKNNRIDFQIIGEKGARNNDNAEGNKESLSLDPRLPKTTIPYKNLNEVAEVLRESGSKEKAFERFKESAWYKNLKDEQKNILNNNKRLRL